MKFLCRLIGHRMRNAERGLGANYWLHRIRCTRCGYLYRENGREWFQ